MRADDIEVTRPCPLNLDEHGVDRSQREFHCDHCDKQVHVLSNHTEAEAEAMLPMLRRERGCVSYVRRSDGTIAFREPTPVVPVARLTIPLRAAAGLALAFAACTPFDPPGRETMVKGGIEAPPPRRPDPARETMVKGGVDEARPQPSEPATPCEPEAAAAAEPVKPPEPAAQPGAARKAKPAKQASATPPTSARREDIVDGGVF